MANEGGRSPHKTMGLHFSTRHHFFKAFLSGNVSKITCGTTPNKTGGQCYSRFTPDWVKVQVVDGHSQSTDNMNYGEEISQFAD